MSYSRSYHASVQYSGSVGYSYPASEHGGSGTAHYSGSVPVDVTIHVDTNPFDGSINHFKSSVNVLTGSVVAMNAAQCAAIKKTAEEVSESVLKGFFGMINTELSQQLQALDSAINTGLGLIQAQGKAVTKKKEEMEGDYNRISSRYVKLFADLDDECYKRIIALDKPSFNISRNVLRELINESTCNAAAVNLISIDETSSSKVNLFVSSINRKTLEILQTLHSYINQESSIKSLIDSFLFSEELDEKTALCIPVIWSQSDMLEDTGVNSNCYIPNPVEQQGKQSITDIINKYCGNAGRAKWKPADKDEKETLNREFNLLAETQFASSDEETQQRIYKTMMSLWQNAETLSI